MTIATTSVEACLLFGDPPRQDLALLAPEMRRVLAAAGAPAVHSRSKTGEHVLFHCDRVQVLLAVCTVALEISDFEGATRPRATLATDARALDALRAHRASITVLVTDRPGAAGPAPLALKQRICWDLAGRLSAVLGADIVFWSDDDVLYTAGEFAIARRDAAADGGRAAAPRIPPPERQEEEEDSFLSSLVAAGSASAPARSSVTWERVSRGLPVESEESDEDARFLDEDTVRKGTTYGLIAILAALSAPIAIAALFYNVFRGENARLVAQLVAVTALGLGIAWASMHEKLLALL